MIDCNFEFTGISVIIPATNEKHSLERILHTLMTDSFHFVDSVTVAAASIDCTAAKTTKQIIADYGYNINLYIQKSSTLPDLFMEIVGLITSSHFVVLFADGESDVLQLRDMASLAIKNPKQIICASKWMKGAHVVNYGRIHAVCTKSLNAVLRVILRTRATDILSIYQLFPISMCKKLDIFSKNDAGFYLMLLPLAKGVPYTEIPANYAARVEGKSNFSLPDLIAMSRKYVIMAIKIRKEYGVNKDEA